MATRRTPAPTPRDSYHHGELRTALVQHALALMARSGSADFNLRDLASAAGVSHTAVYRHFQNKAALLAAIAMDGFDQLCADLKRACVGLDNDPRAQLVQLGVSYVSMAARHPALFAAMFAPDNNRPPHAAAVLAAAERAYDVMVQAVMRRQGATQAQDPKVQAEAVRNWALVHGLANLLLSGNLETCLGPAYAARTPTHIQTLIGQLLGQALP